MEIFSALNNWCGAAFGGHGAGVMGGVMPFHFGGILQLLIIGSLIYFAIRMIRKPENASAGPNAEEILNKRYASGEIDEQTYARMKDDLR